MALIGTPPWLIPTDVIGAMSAGGRLGLGRAELGERANEAAQRTGLGYAQLGADQASAGAALHAKLAEHALSLALHQSNQEEERRKDLANEALRGMAIEQAIKKDQETQEETKRAHTAAEALGTKKQEDIFKKQQIDLAHRALMEAQREYHDTLKNNPKGVDEAKLKLENARREYDRLSGGFTDLGDLSSALTPMTMPAAVPGDLLMPGSSLQLPTGFPGLTPYSPAETSSGLQYEIKPRK